MTCEKCGSATHLDDAMDSRCNSCEHLVRQCICKDYPAGTMMTEQDELHQKVVQATRDYHKKLVVQAAMAWYDKLVETGHYSADDLALNHSRFRSDKWPPEVELAAAVERLKGLTATDAGDPFGPNFGKSRTYGI